MKYRKHINVGWGKLRNVNVNIRPNDIKWAIGMWSKKVAFQASYANVNIPNNIRGQKQNSTEQSSNNPHGHVRGEDQ